MNKTKYKKVKCVICGEEFDKTCSKKCCSPECSKVLDSMRGKKWRDTHQEENKAMKDKWYKDNKERVTANKKKYYEDNKDKSKIRDKAYYEKNKDRIKVRDRDYREKNKIKINDRAKEYYKQNQDRLQIKSKGYYEKSKKNICIVCGGSAPEKFCTKKCMGIEWSGENHHNWQGGKSFEIYPREWTLKLRKLIRERDNNICMRCGKGRELFKHALSVHHIDANKDNLNSNNLISLCDHINSSCHGMTRGREYLYAEGFRKLLKRLYGYKYENINIEHINMKEELKWQL